MVESIQESKTYIESTSGLWEVVIGLEVHAQVLSKAKLFSGAATAFPAEPNSQVSLVDAAFPGMLPVLNAHCIEQAVKTGLGLNAKINLNSRFDRKNYFYADLPAGYQISQFAYPIVGEGYLDIELEGGVVRRIGIERLHLEQDAGKSFHDQHPSKSYIDLNRSGIALMEIVSKPDMHSSEEAMAYMKKLRALLRCLGTNDGNMEEGSLRADVNVSVRRPGGPLGTRAEIKNINSIRFIGQAIEHETRRQIAILEEGGSILQETRLYDPTKGETRSMRSKEEAHDYRYFPEPDLLPLKIEAAYVEAIKNSLPELPDVKKARFMKNYGLPPYDASLLVGELEIAEYYEQAVSKTKAWQENQSDKLTASKLVANWLMGDFFAYLNKENIELKDVKVSPQSLAELITLIQGGTLSSKLAKEVFEAVWVSGEAPFKIVKEKGLEQVSDVGEITRQITEILKNEQEKVLEFKAGKERLFGYFVGRVMQVMKGKGNPQLINEVLKKALNDFSE